MIPGCKTCGAILRRKRVNTRLENMRTFLSREFCDTDCIKAYIFKEKEVGQPCKICGSNRKIQIGNKLCSSCSLREDFNQFLTKEVSHDKTKIRKIEKIVWFRIGKKS